MFEIFQEVKAILEYSKKKHKNIGESDIDHLIFLLITLKVLKQNDIHMLCNYVIESQLLEEEHHG